jgi:tripeptide aminopeptidase
VAAPSQKTFTASFIGRAAHAGIHPEAGINAITVASAAISKIKLGRLDRETTANIGVIEGGVATNIIPEKVTVKGEVRSHNYSKLNQKIGAIKKIFERTAKKAAASLKWEVKEEYRNYRLSSRAPVVRAFVAAERKFGLRSQFKITGGGSDANVFNAAGIPAAVIPTGMEEPHSQREQLKVTTFSQAAALVLELIGVVARGDY